MSQIHSFEEFNDKIEQVVNRWEKHFGRNDITKINLSLLENIYIDYFGNKTAIKYLGSIKKGNEGEFYFTPFVAKTLQSIYQAIINHGSSWQLTLRKDEIMITLPVITSHKKVQIVKEWKMSTENCHIEIRKLRHDFLDYWKKDQNLAKEEFLQKQQQIQKIVEETKTKINGFLKEKIDNLLKV